MWRCNPREQYAKLTFVFSVGTCCQVGTMKDYAKARSEREAALEEVERRRVAPAVLEPVSRQLQNSSFVLISHFVLLSRLVSQRRSTQCQNQEHRNSF